MREKVEIEVYASTIGDRIRDGYNKLERSAVQETVSEAQRSVSASDLGQSDVRLFWSAVQRAFYNGPLRMEKNDNSALHALMREIEALLKEKEAG